jgi:glycosyltransferase involved in cell wall biosynthesis
VKSVTDPVVINPRGLRAYVRNDTFFKAIPLVLTQVPEARFVCPTMAGQAEAERWVSELGLSAAITLLPLQSPAEMAALYRGARVAVSPSEHDGTPNTLLEAMACGCLPVAGDIESLREWITHGENGLLVDPGDPSALAESIIHGLTDDVLQAKARAANDQIVKQRADHARVMPQAREFCLGLVNHL